MTIFFMAFALAFCFDFLGIFWLDFLQYLLKHIPNFSFVCFPEIINLIFFHFYFTIRFLCFSPLSIEGRFIEIRTLFFSESGKRFVSWGFGSLKDLFLKIKLFVNDTFVSFTNTFYRYLLGFLLL